MAWLSGCMAPPMKPWATRKTISHKSEGADPQKKLKRVKPATQLIRRRLRPKVEASQPVMGRTMALATR